MSLDGHDRSLVVMRWGFHLHYNVIVDDNGDIYIFAMYYLGY